MLDVVAAVVLYGVDDATSKEGRASREGRGGHISLLIRGPKQDLANVGGSIWTGGFRSMLILAVGTGMVWVRQSRRKEQRTCSLYIASVLLFLPIFSNLKSIDEMTPHNEPNAPPPSQSTNSCLPWSGTWLSDTGLMSVVEAAQSVFQPSIGLRSQSTALRPYEALRKY